MGRLYSSIAPLYETPAGYGGWQLTNFQLSTKLHILDLK